ncbi:hypothetical protein Mapa_012436 [Marchantia paleacea]|nr:hypothetical protein Mapa_012436 [Marchantia paleacea]
MINNLTTSIQGGTTRCFVFAMVLSDLLQDPRSICTQCVFPLLLPSCNCLSRDKLMN